MPETASARPAAALTADSEAQRGPDDRRTFSGAALARSVKLFSESGAILCYHGVTTPALASQGIINIPAEEFDSTIGVLRRLGEIVPLRDLVDRHLAGKRSNGLFAVTFDDAYASLLETVIPTVDQSQIPITLFACTGNRGHGLIFWWDRLEDLFPRVSVERWATFEASIGIRPPLQDHRDGGRLGPLRHCILELNAGRLPASLDAALTALEAEVGWSTQQRSLSVAELEDMATRPWIDVGVHTVTHPVLPALPEREARWEIEHCFRTLRERCPRTVPLLAIPYGLFDRETARIARDAGMQTCLSSEGRTLARDHDPGVLPRFVVTTGQKGWKLALKVTGIRERVRG
jgi:peptidoglycan/xylan/chitin deacetylase (PgdA/CDA1 family)